MIPEFLSPLLNHLWQSTVFAVVAGLLTVALRKSPARTRYWLWLAASAKFLIPFYLLVSIGSHIEWRTAHAMAPPEWPLAVERISKPFIAPLASPRLRPVGPPAAASPIPALLFLAWACGSAGVLFSCWLRWRRIYLAKRQAYALDLPIHIKVMSSPALSEPAVFGILRPVLLLPQGITGRLSPAQLDAIFAHELCHVRRRDNLAATLHMVVEAIFWFHPLVWWLGARLVEERERACDEAVVQSGHETQVYAEGILEVCKFYLESPWVCAAGLSGANLEKRIEAIMTAGVVHKLSLGGKLLLAAAPALAVAIPILAGLVNAAPSQTQLSKMGQPRRSFEAVSIKISTDSKVSAIGSRGPYVTSTPPTLTVKNTTLLALIRIAYQGRGFQISGGPAWIDSDRYDIAAKAKGLPIPEWIETMGPMLQALLEDRFDLRHHLETKQLPVYALSVAQGGLKMQKAKESCTAFQWDRYPPPPGQTASDHCGVVDTGPNIRLNHTLDGAGASITDGSRYAPGLMTFLSHELDRPVIDKTGLTGLFDFHLEWNRPATARLLGSAAPYDPSKTASSDDPDSPSIFTALQEQLGLKLESDKGPIQVLVIDHAEKPSEK